MFLSRVMHRVPCSGLLFRRTNMVQQELFERAPESEDVIYTMTIRLRNGKVIRRANGRPFRIVIRRKAD